MLTDQQHQKRRRRKTSEGSCGGRQAICVILLNSCLLSLVSQQNLLGQAEALADCDFEHYKNGCFSQANFECDIETNKCRCQAQSPILIDDHFCVSRAKAYESCRYSAQCDNERGYYCLATLSAPIQLDQNLFELVECSPTSTHCRCLGDGSVPATNLNSHGSQQQHHQSQQQQQSLAQTNKHQRPHDKRPSNFRAHENALLHHQQQHHQQPHHDMVDKQHNIHYSATTLLARFVWIFLILILLVLITLLILIKYQSFRTVDRPFHRAEDRVSISSELDVPPPYEVAIRMKV